MVTNEKTAYLSKQSFRGLLTAFQNQKYCLHLLVEICSRINPDSSDLSQLKGIEIDLGLLKDRMKLYDNNVVSILKKTLRTIRDTSIEIQNDKYWTAVSFIERPQIRERDSVVKVNVSPEFLPHLTELKHFLELKTRILGASSRAVLFYSALKLIHSRKIYRMSISELQEACRVRYDYGDFKRYFLHPVIDELKDIGIDIKYYQIKVGNKVDSLRFEIKEDKLPEIPEVPKVTGNPGSRLQNDTDSKPKGPGLDTIKELFAYFNEQIAKAFGDKRQLRVLTSSRQNEFRKLLKDYSIDEVKAACVGFCKDDYERRQEFLDVKYIARHIDKYLATGSKAKQKQEQSSATADRLKRDQEVYERMFGGQE